MTSPPKQEVTEMLVAWSGGDESALERLIPLVHDPLRRLAHRYMSGERHGHMRFFGGLNIEETAEVLKVSPGTVMRDWRRQRCGCSEN
jgi:hypothetical protein